jgi:hypothetical protein
VTREEREAIVRQAIEDWDADRATSKIVDAWEREIRLQRIDAYSVGVFNAPLEKK